MLKIVTTPNSILTTTTKKVERFDDELRKLVKDMEQTLKAQTNPQGVGLAAPQVGKDLSIFVIKPTSDAKTEVFINPRILNTFEVFLYPTSTSKVKKTQKKPHFPSDSEGSRGKTKLEGCLSIPKIWGTVNRAAKILLEYQDLTGKVHKKRFSGFKALIIQHEVDHLTGVLFTQRALEQNAQLLEEKEGELMPLRFQNAKA